MCLAANPLKEIEVAHILGQIDRCGNLAVVEDCPPPVFENMGDIVPAVGGGTHVADKSHQLVSATAIWNVSVISIYIAG